MNLILEITLADVILYTWIQRYSCSHLDIFLLCIPREGVQPNIYRQTDREIDRGIDKEIDREIHREIDRDIDREIEREIDMGDGQGE